MKKGPNPGPAPLESAVKLIVSQWQNPDIPGQGFSCCHMNPKFSFSPESSHRFTGLGCPGDCVGWLQPSPESTIVTGSGVRVQMLDWPAWPK